MYAGKSQVAQIIGAIDVLDIKVVVVAPAYWPSLIVPPRIAAVLEAVITAPHLGMAHVERVIMTEMGGVIGVRNAAIIAPTSAATVASCGLCPLPGGLLRLCALRLCFLCPLLRLCFLCPLLRLCSLCMLRLLLVLRWLSFLPASALFLVAFLCERRNGGCEK